MSNFLDTFTPDVADLASHVADSGEAWTKINDGFIAGDIAITSGGAINAGGFAAGYKTAWTPPAADYLSTVRWIGSPTGELGLLLRFVAGPTCYLGRWRSGAGYELYKVVAGVPTQLGSTVAGTTPIAGDVLTFEISGSATTTLTLKLNGTSQLSVDDTSSPITAAGQLALWSVSSGKTDRMTGTGIGGGGGGATTYTLAGPTYGPVAAASANFTLTLDAAPTGTIVITPAAAGCTFTPSTISFSGATVVGTFTCTAAAVGAKTISATNNGGLTNPANVTYTAKATATKVLVADGGPLTSTVGYRLDNLDASLWSERTLSGVINHGNGVFSVQALVPADLAGIIVWDDGSVFASESLADFAAAAARTCIGAISG